MSMGVSTSDITNKSVMQQNPSSVTFFKQYCKTHPKNFLHYICDNQQCEYYLNFQCHECRPQHPPHECPRTDTYIRKLHQQVIGRLTGSIQGVLDTFEQGLRARVGELRAMVGAWYSPMDDTTTEREFVHVVENPGKWEQIEQTAVIKDSLISARLKEIGKKYKKQMEELERDLNLDMQELKYRNVPAQWKFDRNFTHEHLTVCGYRDSSITKKTEHEKYFISILNQPLTPMKPQINFVINSQNHYNHSIFLGVCARPFQARLQLQSDLKQGLYAIYQASKSTTHMDALSLHADDPAMHYKQAVGWNFGVGDVINVSMRVLGNGQVRVGWRKVRQRLGFEMEVVAQRGLLFPVVGVYQLGDKVSIEGA